MSEDRLLEMLDEAMAARVIEELPRPAGRYQFTHALIQETLAGELSSARRVRLHARIAQALEALYGAQADDHAAELAYHFGEAESVLGTDKLVHYSLIAGEKALAAYAYEDAAGPLPARAGGQGGTARGRADGGDALRPGPRRGGPRHAGRGGCASDEAFDYYAQAGDVHRCMAVASVNIYGFVGNDLMAPVVERALQLAPPESAESWPAAVHARQLSGRHHG